MNGLDLFSGIGGNSIALRDYIKTVVYCENDRYAQSVILSRMSEGELNRAPIWDDITTLKASEINIPIHIIIAGFPCQDISIAGDGKGLAGKRSGLFFEIIRLAKEIKPPFIFLENVPAIRTRGLSTVLTELAEAGYDSRYGFLSAYDMGAPHIRERWFLLAHANANSSRLSKRNEPRESGKEKGSQARCAASGIYTKRDWSKKAWTELVRMDDGIPNRVERIKRIGNAVVSNQAKEAFERLIGLIPI